MYAFNYKTISYCIQSFDKSSITLVQEYDCEKEDSESEKSGEKNEKDEIKDFSEYLFFHKIHTLITPYELSVIMCRNLLYATSDYSKSIYMPPEHI